MSMILNLVVSILVLMDLCIKTTGAEIAGDALNNVSILVLMDLCIKTNMYACPSGVFGSFQSLF